MAITATDIYVRSGNAGSFTQIDYVKGGWITVPSASDMIALDPSRVGEGQVVYVQHTNALFIGSFFEAFVTPGYSGFSNSQSFAPFSWPGSGGGGGGNTDTGSLLTTASVSNNDITFTKGDGTTFTITVDTGSGGGGGGATDISSLNAFTSSISTRVDNLEVVTGSYAITGSNTFIGNQTIDGLLILTTQSSEPTFISGGLYLDTNYNLYIGGS